MIGASTRNGACRGALRRLPQSSGSALASSSIVAAAGGGGGGGRGPYYSGRANVGWKNPSAGVVRSSRRFYGTRASAGNGGGMIPVSTKNASASAGRPAKTKTDSKHSYSWSRSVSSSAPASYSSSVSNKGPQNANATRDACNVNTSTSSSIDIDRSECDRLVVVGSGVAGCAAALVAAQTYRVPVTLLFAGSVPTDCNSYWAQGGIIYRNYDPAAKDSAESLANDIHRAGAGLCVDEAVRKLATEGPDRVRQLLLDERPDSPFANVPFDRRPDGSLSVCLEASHAAPRILHKADHSGAAITEHITRAAVNHPLVTVVPDTIVTDLAVVSDTSNNGRICVGAHTLHRHTRRASTVLAMRGTLLASGGIAGIYEHSTNPLGGGFNALGSSTALAVRSSVRTQDLEYVQFHPTSLYLPGEARFLLTEALRGEGAILRDASGRAFASDFHPDGELAPRDVVARGVYAEAQKSRDDGLHNAYLDISHRDGTWLRERFPSIDTHLGRRGLDLTRDPLPVIPAAHYTCGGVSTDLHGRTTLKGLYSAGEAARTGLHGGNRLASTSLLEGLVYGAAVADDVGGSGGEGEDVRESALSALLVGNAGRDELWHQANEYRSAGAATPPLLVNGEAQAKVDEATLLLAKIKRTMWDGAGVVRTPSGLSRALDELGGYKDEAEELYVQCPAFETAAVRDAAYAGEAVARAALSNRVSRGAHTIVLDDDDDDDDDDDEEKSDLRQRRQQREDAEDDDDDEDEEVQRTAGIGV